MNSNKFKYDLFAILIANWDHQPGKGLTNLGGVKEDIKNFKTVCNKHGLKYNY